MRAILHARLGARVAKLSSASDKVTRISPNLELRDSCPFRKLYPRVAMVESA